MLGLRMLINISATASDSLPTLSCLLSLPLFSLSSFGRCFRGYAHRKSDVGSPGAMRTAARSSNFKKGPPLSHAHHRAPSTFFGYHRSSTFTPSFPVLFLFYRAYSLRYGGELKRAASLLARAISPHLRAKEETWLVLMSISVCAAVNTGCLCLPSHLCVYLSACLFSFVRV